MIASAIRRILDSGQHSVARLSSDPEALRLGAAAARRAIPLPFRWFVPAAQIQKALATALRSIPPQSLNAGTVSPLPAASAAPSDPVSTADPNESAVGVDSGFKHAMEHLASLGIQLAGNPSQCSVSVPVQKLGWTEPMMCELAKVLRDGNSYTVLVLALPYFCGPNWQTVSGGKPLALQCESIQEVVQVLERALANRMQDRVLHVE